MIRRILTALLTGGCTLTGFAQNGEQTAGGDPDCDAVVRLHSVEYVYSSPTLATTKTVDQITILKPSGDSKADFTYYVSDSEELKNFSGTITDATGKVVRKLKRSDLKYTEYSASLAAGSAYYFLRITYPTYPYTVQVETESVEKNGVLMFQPFMPLSSFGTALDKAIYKISLPQGMEFGCKSSGMGEPRKSSDAGRDTYVWELENHPGLKNEPRTPPLLELTPFVFASPYEFQYHKTRGSLRDWASFGAWLSEIQAGRDVLPEALKQEVHRRTDHLATPREKVRALYDYLGETTRYVSIQLGIGGLRPMSAAEVYNTKFGDCKGLTNYLKAMLTECGIQSDYTIIHTDREHMFSDYVSPNQANHAILRVPLEADTLWLECTNPRVPFGYIHDNIAGHDALLLREGRGVPVTLPHYADTLNRQIIEAEITLAEDGTGTGRITERYQTGQYDHMQGYSELEAKKQTEILLEALKIPLVRVENITVEEDKSPLPSIGIGYQIVSPKYCNISGTRWFLPQTPFVNAQPYKGKERRYDIYYSQGYLDITRITYLLPEQMILETAPAPRRVEMPFGSYELRIAPEKDRITIEQRTCMHAGTYPRDIFEQYRNFLTERAKTFNANLVLKKR